MYVKRSCVHAILLLMGALFASGIGGSRSIAATVQEQIASAFRAGEDAMRSGQYDRAVAEFKIVLQLDPTLSQAHTNLGLADYMLGRYQSSAFEFEEALRGQPSSLPANLFLGVDYLRLGSAGRARPPLQQAIRLAPSNLLARHALFECYLALGNYLNAMQQLDLMQSLDADKKDALFRFGQGYLEIAKRLAPTIAHNPVWAHRLGGDLLAERGWLEDAAHQYQQALGLDPAQAGLHLAVGKVYSRQGNTKSAEKEFQLALRLDPDSAQAYLNLAWVALAESRADSALDDVAEAWKVCPYCLGERLNHALPMPGKQSALNLLNQLDAASARPAKEFLIALLARETEDSVRSQQATKAFQVDLARRIKTEEGRPSGSRGLEICGKGEVQACITYLRSRQTLSPGDNLTIAKTLFAFGNVKRAAIAFALAPQRGHESIENLYWLCRASITLADQSFRELATAFPDSWQSHLLRAETLHLEHDESGAIREYKAAAALKPNDPELYDALGELYLNQDAVGRAAPELQEAIRLDPSRARTLYLLGRLYVAEHDWSKAIAYLRKALLSNPSLLEAHSLLGRAYLHVGNASAAVPQLERAAPSDYYGDIHYQLFQAYRTLGKPGLAQKALAEAQVLRKRSAAIDRAKITSAAPSR